jgi:hypothetical protein
MRNVGRIVDAEQKIGKNVNGHTTTPQREHKVTVVMLGQAIIFIIKISVIFPYCNNM